MLEFNVKDYHKEYVSYYLDQCEILKDKIHVLHTDMYNIYDLIHDSYNQFKVFNIDILNVISLKTNGKSIRLFHFYNDETKIFISRYNHLLLIIENIKKLADLLNQFTFYARIPYIVFKVILYSNNFEITIQLLKGNKFSLPVLGEIYIARVPYDSSIPDWGNSMKFKDYLINKGLTPKDKDNENGKLWLVDNGLDRDDFVLLRWSKYSSKLINKGPYRLVPCTFGNIYSKSLKRIFDIKELIYNTKTGLFDKIMHLYRYHYQYTQDSYPYVNIVKSKKEL